MSVERTPQEMRAWQQRAEAADKAMGQWIAAQIGAWAADYANENPGQTLLLSDSVGPLLAGAHNALARLVWNSLPPGTTPAQAADYITKIMLPYLERVARNQPAGGFAGINTGKPPSLLI